MAAVATAQVPVDVEAARIAQMVFNAFQHSYSPWTEERRQAEAAIQSAERMPGFLVALLRIAMEGSADPAIRQAAAIQLKNQVKRWWHPVGEEADAGYSEQEKTTVRDQLVGAITGAIALPKIRDQLVECLRFAAREDFPDRWMGLVGSVLAGLNSDDIPCTYGALLVLRRLYKQLELRPVARRGDMEALCAATLPTLGNLAPSLAQVATEEALVMLKLVLKCVYSSLHISVTTTMRQGLDVWMRFVLAVAALPVPLPQLPADTGSREVCPFAKVKKWAFQILFRFFHRHGDRRRAVDGMEALADYWLDNFGVAATQVCIREACSLSADGWAPRHSAALALLCLGRACSKAATYEVMSPVLQRLLVDGIFPWVRLGMDELALWREDQEEVVRQLNGDVDAFQEPRVAALELVEKLVVHRRGNVLLPLLQFSRSHLEAHAAACSSGPGKQASLALCVNKDGALRILGTIGDELVSLDASQQGRGRKKKSSRGRTVEGSTGGSEGYPNVKLEELIARYVQPDLASPMAFLRLRACWVYQKMVEKMHFCSAEASVAACAECLRLADDTELPVRVQACICLQAFLQRDSDEGIRRVVVQNLAEVLERLLRTLAEVSCDEVSETLETVAAQFPEEIAPFAVRLVEQLAAQFGEAFAEQEGEEGEDADGTPLCSAQTIVTIVQSCSMLRDPRDPIERGRRQDLFTGLTRSLFPLLSRLLRFDGSGRDVLEETLELLSHLTLFGSSPFPAELWDVVPFLYEAVCGRTSAAGGSLSSTASASACEPPKFVEGWALDALPEMLEPLANFIARGPPEVFIARTWGGLRYPQMVFSMMGKVLGLRGLGHERDGAAGALLAVVLFENAPAGGLDYWIPSFFDATWRRWPSVASASLRSALLTLLAILIWYNAEVFLRCAEERQCAQQLVEAWLSNACVVKSLPRRKIMVLGLVRLLRLSFQSSLPSSITPCLAHMTRQLAEQSRQITRLRSVHEALAARERGDSSTKDWTFGDAPCLSSGAPISMPRPGENGHRIVEADEEDVDEDEVLSVPFGDEVDRRPSKLDTVDELVLLLEVLRCAPDLARRQVDLWLGDGELVRWEAKLDVECSRIAAPAGRTAAVAG